MAAAAAARCTGIRSVRPGLARAATQSRTAAEATIPDRCLTSVDRSAMPDEPVNRCDHRRQVGGERYRQRGEGDPGGALPAVLPQGRHAPEHNQPQQCQYR